MIVFVVGLIFVVTLVFSILYVFDKRELAWPLMAALGWTVLGGLSWNIEYIFAYETAGVVTFAVYDYSGGVFLMWFFFGIAILFAILTYQRAMQIQLDARKKSLSGEPDARTFN